MIRIFEIFLILVGLFTVASSFFHDHLFFELSSHFRFQYFLFTGFLFAFYLVKKKKYLSVVFFVLFVYNAFSIIPWYIAGSNNLKVQRSNSIKILHANVNVRNTEKHKLVELILSENPDVITLQEIDSSWVNSLLEVGANYPYSYLMPQSGNFGIGLYSKFPIKKKSELTESEFGVPTLSVILEVNKRALELVVTHPFPPINNQLFNLRNMQLKFIAEYLVHIDSPVILMGDLNASMWSKHFIALQNKSGLQSCRLGHGVLATWPVDMYPLRIPIDHCLASEEFKVITIKLGDNIGSDHLPLIIELQI